MRRAILSTVSILLITGLARVSLAQGDDGKTGKKSDQPPPKNAPAAAKAAGAGSQEQRQEPAGKNQGRSGCRRGRGQGGRALRQKRGRRGRRICQLYS